MAELNTIARPYAKAVFDFAIEKDSSSLGSWHDMLFLSSNMVENNVFMQKIENIKDFNLESKFFIDFLNELKKQNKQQELNENEINFIKILIKNKRLKVLPNVAELFLNYKAEFEKEIDASVVSAVELTKEQKATLIKTLSDRLERTVKLNCSIDETLIAGMLINVGDIVIDNSARGQLSKMSEKLQA